MSGRELLLRNKELTSWWVGVCHDARFEEVIALASYEIAARNPTKEIMEGVNVAYNLMATITDNPQGFGNFPSAGLVHELPKKKIEPQG